MPAPYVQERFSQVHSLCQALNAPIAVLDIESSGFGNWAGIVEFAFITIDQQGDQHFKTFRVNPGVKIDQGASAIHNIYDADVAHLPKFDIHLDLVDKLFEQNIAAGFNSSTYDIPKIKNVARRHGTILNEPEELDVMRVWKRLTGYTRGKLLEVAALYQITPGVAHNALGDVQTTARILDHLVGLYGVQSVLQAAHLEPRVQWVEA